MKIESLLGQPNITVAVTPADLKEFAQTIIDRIIASTPKGNTQKDEVYLTPNETAAKLGVSKNSLWRWNKIGYLCPIKVGRKSLYPLSMINALLKLSNT